VARPSGMRMRIEGLDQLRGGAARASREFRNVMRDIMRGPFGDELERDLVARLRDNDRTGYTASRVRKTPTRSLGSDGVEIGIPEGDRAKHPSSPRANARSIGIWLESGTRAHMIPTNGPRRMMIGGRIIRTRIVHPGTKAYRPMGKTLRVFKYEAERLVVRELDRRLGPKLLARKG
jgi:hypothetical protein